MNTVDNQSGVYNAELGLLPPVPAGGCFLPFYNSATLAAADSGITVNNLYSAAAVSASNQRKRSRDSFPGCEISSLIQQQTQEIDRVIVDHMAKIRSEFMERRRRFWIQAVAAAEEAVAKRIKATEEEIVRIGVLNWAMEERIRSMCVENQIWRELAQSNEAAVTVLRASLEQVMAAQVRVKEEEEEYGAAAAAEDGESCCCGDNREVYEERRAAGAAEDRRKGVCRNCGERESTVLLLPCRHLCLCAACRPINVCPICKCTLDGSVDVNII